MAEKTGKGFPETFVAGLILNKGRMLLVSSDKWWGKWTLPGGPIQIGESLEHALKRALAEQLGLNINVEKLVNVQEAVFPKDYYIPKHFIILNILCLGRGDNVSIDKRTAPDLLATTWVQPEKALDLNINGFTRDTIKAYLRGKETGAKRKKRK